MSDLKTVKTVILDASDSEILSTKLAAVNNDVRCYSLEILRDFEKGNKLVCMDEQCGYVKKKVEE